MDRMPWMNLHLSLVELGSVTSMDIYQRSYVLLLVPKAPVIEKSLSCKKNSINEYNQKKITCHKIYGIFLYITYFVKSPSSKHICGNQDVQLRLMSATHRRGCVRLAGGTLGRILISTRRR